MHDGRYQAGFKLFEYRWHPDILANQLSPYPREPKNVPTWEGQSLLGKSIVIQAEQGYGDIFMYARFFPALKVLGASKVILLAHSSLLELFGQMECIDVLTNLTEEGPAVEADYWIGSMSLPYYIDCSMPYVKQLFPVTEKKIVGSEGYLETTPSNIPAKIGVNWRASKNALYHIKSMDAREMLSYTGDQCYSLNPEENSYFYELPDNGWRKSWAKTAQHMKAMKGIVTVDTGTAHLAGALGIKTIVLLPKDEFVCWRWKHGRWYDSVVALRQDEYHKVAELIRRM